MKEDKVVVDQIKKIIIRAVKDFGVGPEDFSVDTPDNKMHGDYSSNIALVLSKKLGKNPREVADSVKQKIGENKLFSKIEIAILSESSIRLGVDTELPCIFIVIGLIYQESKSDCAKPIILEVPIFIA
jgi:hypothetical protein